MIHAREQEKAGECFKVLYVGGKGCAAARIAELLRTAASILYYPAETLGGFTGSDRHHGGGQPYASSNPGVHKSRQPASKH
jgi:hypothetical protein